jgi:protein-S-isoprenylcysteine O-methyltransferase Ste14
MLYDFSHSVLGICMWDLPALIVLIAIIVTFVVHRAMMKKRENELENELADKYADVKEANPNTIQQFGAKA